MTREARGEPVVELEERERGGRLRRRSFGLIWICQSRDGEHRGGDGADDGERRAESARGGDLCGDVLTALRAVALDDFHGDSLIIILGVRVGSGDSEAPREPQVP